MKTDSKKLVVDSSQQTLELWADGKIIRSFRVSTGKNGMGCTPGSMCTPTGRLRIVRKIGDGSPPGTVFRARNVTGETWSQDASNPLAKSDDDLILSRIMWLAGTEASNINTLERYIYIHGTNQEHLLGQRASHGCIRMSNDDVIALYDLVDEGALVEIA